MAAQAKFLFDVDFGAGQSAKEAEPTITATAHQAALAEAQAQGYREGLSALEAQLKTEAERKVAAAFARIAEALEQLARSIGAVEGRFEAESVEVAVAVARKLAPQLIAREPLAEIAALANECFGELLKAPTIVQGASSCWESPTSNREIAASNGPTAASSEIGRQPRPP